MRAPFGVRSDHYCPACDFRSYPRAVILRSASLLADEGLMKLSLCAVALALAVPVSAQTISPDRRANPLLSPSTLPFQAPPFDKITDADFQPAIEEGMKQQLAEIASIANN